MKQMTQIFEPVIQATEVFYLSHSKVVLQWIKNFKERYKQFVQNRVKGIRKKTDISRSHHIKANNNMADIASIGCMLREITRKGEWFQCLKWHSGKIGIRF